MYYIRTADKLTRTATWLDKMDGGINYLKDVLIEDRLGICAELERDMQELVDNYRCEWAEVVNDPEKRARFRQFAGEETEPGLVEMVTERGQKHPAWWDETPPVNTNGKRRLQVVQRQWVQVARVEDVPPDGGITVRYGRAQIAVFNFAFRGEWYASQDVCPHRRDAVLSRGIVGDQGGTPKVACPLHKKTFSLRTGECLSGEEYRVQTFPVKIEDGAVFLELPPVAQVEEQLNANGKSCESSACVAQVSPNS
jgi:nitrite reductase (NADH) large subunit